VADNPQSINLIEFNRFVDPIVTNFIGYEGFAAISLRCLTMFGGFAGSKNQEERKQID
jgi:hypothetical protein